MITDQIIQEVRENMDAVIAQDTELSKHLWDQLLQLHPADIARLCSDISRTHLSRLFNNFPITIKVEVFEELSETLKVYVLSQVDEKEQVTLLSSISLDELTDLFDEFSDEELEKYLSIIRKKDREKVISLLQFSPESAGGIMDVNALTLFNDFTGDKSIKVLKRLKPDKDVYRVLYVTTKDNQLVGNIRLEDLVVKGPEERIENIMRPNELVVPVTEDQEVVARDMVHYGLTNVPVVGHDNFLLGVIPSETLIGIIGEEASEDVYRISAMAPIKRTYFDTSFLRLVYERSYILVILLLIESFASSIIEAYEATLGGFLMYFISMLISTGGNTSSQTSALAIQGLATGEINKANTFRFFKRELLMSFVIGLILSAAAYTRVYVVYKDPWASFAISLSLGLIVMTSVILGSVIPLLLKRFNIDPAFSAGPLLATLMDILGIFIYAYLTKLILFS